MSFCWLGMESSCALGGLLSPAESWGAEGRHILQIWTRVWHPKFRISSYLSGHLTQNYHFWKAPQVWCWACDEGKGAFGVTFSNTIWCPQKLQLMTNIIQTWASGCSQSADRKEGWMLQFPNPAQAAEWILHCIGHQGQEEAPPCSCWPIQPALSGAPAPPRIGHIGKITHRLVRLVCFISELFFTLYNI